MVKSFAEWPPEVFTAMDGSHISTDTHETEDEANSICNLLSIRGFGGNGPLPVRVWVEHD